MLHIKNILTTLATVAAVMSLSSCSDYDYDKEMSKAEISGPITVKSRAGNVYKGVLDGDKVYIKVNPYVDVQDEMSGAVPCFYMPMNAVCDPAPYEPQDFNENVVYTIKSSDGKETRTYTFIHVESEQLAYGDGYTHSYVLAEKTFPQLGYPGEVHNYDLPSQQFGDLLLSVGFCGPDRLVGYSRVYGWGTDECTPDAENAVRVWNSETLQPTGETLNLGEIKIGEIINVTNDWKGHLVAATGGLNSADSYLYYWTSVDAAPIKVGKMPIPVYFNNHPLDANSAIDVAGDITADAAISFIAPRSANGDHNVVYVKGGAIESSGRITTGFSVNVPSWTQMISLFGPDENANFLVGTTEGERENGSIQAYYEDPTGMLLGSMPPYMNGKSMSDGIVYWSGTGMYGTRGGGRKPFVMAMVLNGAEYSLVLTGYDWEYINVMMNGTMTQFIDDALSYDNRTYVISQGIGAGVIAYNSFGSCGCWYWDDEAREGKVATWMGRMTLTTFRVHCYE